MITPHLSHSRTRYGIQPLSFGVPKTGQETSYVAGPDKDDADFLAGWKLKSPTQRFVSFTQEGLDQIWDLATNLVWIADETQFTGTLDAVITWADVLIYISATVNPIFIGGYNTWRLPNVIEMYSIMNNDPDLAGGTPFDYPGFSTQIAGGAEYWTSTTDVADNTKAYRVDFDNASIAATAKSGSEYARPVRTYGAVPLTIARPRYHEPIYSMGLPKTGQTTTYDGNSRDDGASEIGWERQPPRFVAYTSEGVSLVYDKATDLTWWADPVGDGVIANMNNVVTWLNAFSQNIATINSNALGGYSDWRMPNINELQSIVQYEAGSAPYDYSDFTTQTGAESAYWSSTTAVTNTDRAKDIAFDTALIGSPLKTDTRWTRPVRGGAL